MDPDELRKRLEQLKSLQTLDRVASAMACDFNNLFLTIRAGIESLAETAADGRDSAPAPIAAAIRAIERGKLHAQSLLAATRRGPPFLEPIDIDQAVDETCVLLRLALGNDINVVAQLKSGGAFALVDRGRLANALWNLALNAHDAMAKHRRLAIRTEIQPAEADQGRQEVCVIVEEQAAGFEEGISLHTFETPTAEESDDLGSRLVRSFVEEAGGQYEPARGGFNAIIRLRRVEPPAAKPQRPPKTSRAQPKRRKVALLVESDPELQALVNAQLEYLGYQTQIAGDGDEAVDLIEVIPLLDVVVTELVLTSEKDGMAVVDSAAAIRPGMPILVVAPRGIDSRKLKRAKASHVEVLGKPFSMQELAEAIDRVVARSTSDPNENDES